jgi:hypothetical protein
MSRTRRRIEDAALRLPLRHDGLGAAGGGQRRGSRRSGFLRPPDARARLPPGCGVFPAHEGEEVQARSEDHQRPPRAYLGRTLHLEGGSGGLERSGGSELTSSGDTFGLRDKRDNVSLTSLTRTRMRRSYGNLVPAVPEPAKPGVENALGAPPVPSTGCPAILIRAIGLEKEDPASDLRPRRAQALTLVMNAQMKPQSAAPHAAPPPASPTTWTPLTS